MQPNLFRPPYRLRLFVLAIVSLIVMSGCDLIKQRLGIVDPSDVAAKNAEDGNAVGGACRQSGRAIEDCYAIYAWLPRASIYEGWREMDAYMRENGLETIEPVLPPVAPPDSNKPQAPKDSAHKTETPPAEQTSAQPTDSAPKEATTAPAH